MMKEESMYAEDGDIMIPGREDATRTVVYTTLYDLIAAVDDAIEPGEEDCVASIVAHLLRAGRAHFLRDVDVNMLWDDQAPTYLEEEESCVLV
jgi:hypothetical protein